LGRADSSVPAREGIGFRKDEAQVSEGDKTNRL
jgi:hypothetical protein